jgi:SAM-dependent methyltransferase
LSAVLRRFARAIDLGTPADAVARALAKSGKAEWIVSTAPDAAQRDKSFPRLAADEEALPFTDGALDLVVSGLALQFVNDLPGTLIQIRRALKPDGLLLAALVGGDSLTELRQAFAEAESEIEGGLSPRVAPFADLRELGALLQRAGFALPVVDSDRLTVRYENVGALMHDLRRMGASNVLAERRRKPLKRATLMRMADIYAARFADADGRLRATFEIVWLSGWVPHESQQKPLKPGSAAHRLADALGTREISAGEKAGSERKG